MKSTLRNMTGRFAEKHSSGFTLLELLAAIAVLLILAALVLPVSKTVLKSSQRAGSVSNLRTISAMAAAYSGEHEGYVTPFKTMEWNSLYKSMAGSYMFEFLPRIYGGEGYRVFRRPGDDLTYMGGAGLRSYKGVVVWSYARNISLPRQQGNVDLTARGMILPRSSRVMLFMETIQNGGIGTADASFTHIYFDGPGKNAKCAVAFVDGHSELLTREAMGVKDDGTANVTTPASRELWFGWPESSSQMVF